MGGKRVRNKIEACFFQNYSEITTVELTGANLSTVRKAFSDMRRRMGAPSARKVLTDEKLRTGLSKTAREVVVALREAEARGDKFPGIAGLADELRRGKTGISHALAELKENGILDFSVIKGDAFVLRGQSSGDARRPPGSLTPNAVCQRSCLRCGRSFLSAHAGNRICPVCSSHNTSASPLLEGMTW